MSDLADESCFDVADLIAMAEDMGWNNERLLAAARELVRIDGDIGRLFQEDDEKLTIDPATRKM